MLSANSDAIFKKLSTTRLVMSLCGPATLQKRTRDVNGFYKVKFGEVFARVDSV